MPISCKCILDHLKYKGAITEKEYDKLLRNLKGTEWHPYPQEKPENDDMYIVTTKLKTGVCSVIPAWYSEAFGWNDDDVCCNQVIAWTTFPEPYKEEV